MVFLTIGNDLKVDVINVLSKRKGKQRIHSLLTHIHTHTLDPIQFVYLCIYDLNILQLLCSGSFYVSSASLSYEMPRLKIIS